MIYLFFDGNHGVVAFVANKYDWNNLMDIKIIPYGPLERTIDDNLEDIKRFAQKISFFMDIPLYIYFEKVPYTTSYIDVVFATRPINVKDYIVASRGLN